MQTLITKTSQAGTSHYVEATCENTSALVVIEKDGVRVICQNAMHRAWGGSGRHFPTVEAAVAGYKSGAMKSIIQAAADSAKVPTLKTPSWTPTSFAELAGKTYATARITASAECVRVIDSNDGSFKVAGRFGQEWYGWRELDSFCL